MSDLDEYPFPLQNGGMAYLRLPRHGLDEEDCQRLQEFLWSLVIDKTEDGVAVLSMGDTNE